MPISKHARSLIQQMFPDEQGLWQLFQLVFSGNGYAQTTAFKLVDAAQGRTTECWQSRCAAVLLLEHCLLALSPRNLNEHRTLFRRLGIRVGSGRAREELLKQGYRKSALRGFVTELRRRLQRLEYLHQAVANPKASRDEWADFLALTRQEARLTLARYCFTPQEIAAQICRQTDLSSGVRDIRERDRRWFNPLAERRIKELSALEAGVAAELARYGRIYWVSEKTSSELYAMVEFPLSSAVLVVKPPGNHMEFEIKRAGVRGKRKVTVVTQQNGTQIPVSHQLHGGSFGWLGRREAEAASLFSYVFRLVHGELAPMCITLTISSLLTVPVGNGESHILDYLTRQEIFGEDFEDMRAAMRECIENLPPDCGVPIHPYSGPVGLTLQFLAQARPQQALLLNTTSFRLDRVALYLSDDGPENYFAGGLRRQYADPDARRLADDVLSEVLGTYTRPTRSWHGYRDYVLAALEANRHQADRNFVECMRQLGRFWGTLLGVRGYSDGESFVARNVGLRSVWERGQWRIRLMFMDHDDLFVLGRRKLYFWPYRSVLGMYRDEIHVMGRPLEGHQVKGDVGHLREIYNVNDATAEAGGQALEQSLRQAYEKTLQAVESNRRLRELFWPPFVECLRDWDNIVQMYLESADGGEFWKPKALDYLRNRSYEAKRVRNYINSIEEYSDFLYRMAFLYQSKKRRFMRS